jgi:drug/metabolite transporter (DMT)-like permease
VPLVGLLTLAWGTNWPLYTLAVREVSVWTFRSACLLLGGLLLLLFSALRGDSLRVPREAWGTIAAVALAYLVVWNVSSTYAAVLIPSGQAALLGYTMPFWAVIIERVAYGSTITLRMRTALGFGLIGVGLLATGNLEEYVQAPAGFVLGLSAGLGWAIGTIIFKKKQIPVPPTVSAGWQLLVAAIPVVAVALTTADSGWFVPAVDTLAVTAYIILVPIALGNALWFSIVNRLPTIVAALAPIMVPVIALLAGHIFHNEPLGPRQILAMLACATGWALALIPAVRDSSS